MDILSLQKYHRQGSIVDKEINLLKQLGNIKSLPKGNTTLTNRGAIKTDRDFMDFFINDVPLTELLNKFYKKKTAFWTIG